MIRLRDSTINTSVAGGAWTVGGNITIDPDFIILQNSKIIANAFEGRGGNIRIVAGTFLAIRAALWMLPQLWASTATGGYQRTDCQYQRDRQNPLPKDFMSAAQPPAGALCGESSGWKIQQSCRKGA